MKNAVVLGVNGQDGSYLAEILIDHGYRVLGIGLQESSRYVKENNNYQYVSRNIKEIETVTSILKEYKPCEIYHLAAVHGAAGFQYETVWDDALDVNLKSLYAILEYARNENQTVRIAYASSAKVFGNELIDNISIANQHYSDCLYSITKNAAGDLIKYYYEKYNVYASIAYFFNHDSIRRNEEYFIPTIVRILADSLKNKSNIDDLHTLDFYCDWGCAYEYMTMFKDMLLLNERQEIIIASGETLYARDFIEELFKQHNLDYRDHIKERITSQSSRPFTVSMKATKEILGRTPVKDIYTVCNNILEKYMQTDTTYQ